MSQTYTAQQHTEVSIIFFKDLQLTRLLQTYCLYSHSISPNKAFPVLQDLYLYLTADQLLRDLTFEHTLVLHAPTHPLLLQLQTPSEDSAAKSAMIIVLPSDDLFYQRYPKGEP